MLQWAIEKGCEWCTAECAVSAARGGSIVVLKWMRAAGYPFCMDSKEKSLCYEAAAYGQMAVIKWARAHGEPCNYDKCLEAAAETMHCPSIRWPKMVAWLKEEARLAADVLG